MITEESDKEVVTLEGMLNALDRQLRVSECSLRGMLTLEGDIFIINQPVPKKPSDLQMHACVMEIEKLVSRITERSPRVVTEVPLGSLTRAEIAHMRISSSTSKLSLSGYVIFFAPIISLRFLT